MKVNEIAQRFDVRFDVAPLRVGPIPSLPAIARTVRRAESVINRTIRTPRIAHVSQRLELLSRIQQRHDKLTARHEALKGQAFRNYEATRQTHYLQAAREHHAALHGHRSIADHARKEWVWLAARGRP